MEPLANIMMDVASILNSLDEPITLLLIHLEMSISLLIPPCSKLI